MATRIRANVTYHSTNIYGRFDYLDASKLRVSRGAEHLTVTYQGQGGLRGCQLIIPIEAALTLGGLITTVAQGQTESIEVRL